MKKRKLFFLISILVLICLFTVAALCNQCSTSVKTEETSKIDIDEKEQETTTSYQSAIDDKDTSEAVSDDKPTIQLRIYEGPLYSGEDDVCYYRVEAEVTGNPLPSKANFNKDDSNGSWGLFKTQVNLTRTEPIYTLIATVSTSMGADRDSIELVWACDVAETSITEEEEDIDCLTIYLAPVTSYDGTLPCSTNWYFVCHVKDLEGNDISDRVSYDWELSNGIPFDIHINPDGSNVILFITPDTPGTITLTTTITYGSCVESETITIEITC